MDLNDLDRVILEKKNKNRELKHEKVYNDITDALIDINCRECNSLHIKEIDGYYTCLDCGLRNDNVIDFGQEWRYYGNDDNKGNDPARCDIPTNELLPKASMGSFVGYGSKETATTKRIRNMNQWYAMPYKELTLLETFNNITVMAQNSGINQCIIEEAKYMYKKVSEMKSSRRTKKEGMKAGSIALACKLKGVPRNCIEIAKICHLKNNKVLRKSIKTFEEIWNIIQSNEKDITNQTISNNLELNHNLDKQYIKDDDINDSDLDTDSDLDDNIDDYIAKLHRCLSLLGVDDKLFQICKNILICIEQNNYLDKHNPSSRIAAVIFYANEYYKLNINKYQITKICEISEVTVNKCYVKLLKYTKEFNALFTREVL